MSLRDEVQDVFYDEWLTDRQYETIIALVLDSVLNHTLITRNLLACELEALKKELKEKDDE